MKKYHVINDHDRNDSIEIEAESYDEAAHEALERLGWYVVEQSEE